MAKSTTRTIRAAKLTSYAVTLAVFFGGCITPPEVSPGFLQNREQLSLVASLQKGFDQASSGRYDLAELQFRKALAKGVKTPEVYNNLGYSLEGQNRLDEAQQAFQDALAVDPTNAAAMENLARTHYRKGEVEAARELYDKLLLRLMEWQALEPTRSELAGFNANDIPAVLRDMSIVAWTIGDVNEAACLSEQSYERSGKEEDLTRYVRLLLSIGRTAEAVRAVQARVSASGPVAQGTLLFDYGLGLYSLGNKDLASEALVKALALPGLKLTERISARLLVDKLGDKSKQPAETDTDGDPLLSDFPTLCEDYKPDPEGYYPLDVVEALKGLVAEKCASAA